MSHLPTVWLKENQVRLVGSSRSFTCNYTTKVCLESPPDKPVCLHIFAEFTQAPVLDSDQFKTYSSTQVEYPVSPFSRTNCLPASRQREDNPGKMDKVVEEKSEKQVQTTDTVLESLGQRRA